MCLTWLEGRSVFTKGKERLFNPLKKLRSMTMAFQCLNHSRNAQLSLLHCWALSNCHHFCDERLTENIPVLLCCELQWRFKHTAPGTDVLKTLVSELCSWMFLKCYESVSGCAFSLKTRPVPICSFCNPCKHDYCHHIHRELIFITNAKVLWFFRSLSAALG